MTNSILTEEQKAAKKKWAERREVINSCCTVTGAHPLLGLFEEDIFKYDNWNVEDALNYLAGVKIITFTKNIPDSLELWTLSLENYSAVADSDIIKRFENEIGRLWKIWNSGHHDNPNPPNYYIEWALSKNIKIHWLDYAIDKGLVRNINKDLLFEKNINKKELFDKDSSTYPLELDCAMQAWEAVKNDKSKGKPKAKIKAWLDANTQLSNEAKDRISIVVNWDKTGGATRTD